MCTHAFLTMFRHITCGYNLGFQVVAYLLRYGSAIMKTASTSGQTVAHTCSWFGTVGCLKLLLRNGCNAWRANCAGQHPLHLAVLRGHLSCAQALIKSGAPLDCADQGGNTPLHAAVLAGHYDCVQELVNFDADVNLSNRDNGAPLHYASRLPLVSLLIASGADPSLEIREAGSAAKEGKTAFNLYLDTMPEGCNEIMNKYLRSNGKSLGAVDLELSFDYDLFSKEMARNPPGGEIGLLMNICQSGQRDILKHPVCESFLHMKWLLVKRYFSAYLAFYVLFLVSQTLYVFVEFSPAFRHTGQEWRPKTVLVSLVLFLATLGILLLKNVLLFFYNFRQYVDNLHNITELTMVAVSGVFVALHNFGTAADVVVHLAAVCLFLSWFNFTLLLGKLPSGGIYINMIVGVSKDVLKFLLLYASTIVAFGFAFHILAHHQEHFEDPLSSVLCMLAMMVGEFNFGDLFVNSQIRYHWTTQIMFVAFLLLVSIIIMNLLVGLAISNITGQFMLAGVYRLKMTVMLIRLIEDVMSVARRIFPCCFRNSGLMNHLKSRDSNISSSVVVFVYPNHTADKNAVFVREGKGGEKLRRTGFVLPPWIMANTFKLLRVEHENSASSLQAASDSRRQNDRLYKLGSEVRSIKRDLMGLRNDVHTIANFVKTARGPPPPPPTPVRPPPPPPL